LVLLLSIDCCKGKKHCHILDILFLHFNFFITLCVWLADGGWRLAAGGWRLAVGGWRLAAGGWRLAAGGWRLAYNHSLFNIIQYPIRNSRQISVHSQ
jgi:hypothetical protein